MEEGLNYLQTFNPVESKAELLEKTLTGRKKLVDLLEQLAIESATSGNKFQKLIIGPRGSGKTHLLRVLYNRVSGRDDLKDKLKIAYLCEDEYGIASFLDFILRIFKAFIKWSPEDSCYLVEEINKLKKVPAADQEKGVVNILLKHIEGTTLLIIVENIGNIFAGIGVDEQRKFRDLVQQYPIFTIMASNQALFKDVQNEDRPFHNFFKITHLKKLTLTESIQFLKSIAEWEEKKDLLRFLNEPEGRGRINAIYDITGGNHRLLVTFYNFLKIDYKHDLSYSFIKTINDLIPYYQSFMNLLSPLPQKIVQYLCQTRKPSNVKEIAENCFSAPNTISKQMSNLVKLKYVDATPSGKETFYELSEPLLRICFEVKENRGGPVKLFIDFLGNLYSVQEIKKKYMQYHILSKISPGGKAVDFFQEYLYYKETLKLYFQDKLEQFKIDEFEKTDKDLQVRTYIEELEKAGEFPEILEFTSVLQQKDRYLLIKEAKDSYEKAINLDKKNVLAGLGLAMILAKEGNFKEAEIYVKRILSENPEDANILNTIGEIYRESNGFEKAIPYYETAMRKDPKFHHPYFNIVSCRIGENKVEEALSTLNQALKLVKDINLTDIIIENFDENLTTLFIHGSKNNISRYLHEAFSLIKKYNYKEQFFKAMPQAIFRILIQHEEIEMNRFAWIESILNEMFYDHQEMVVALKFLNIGIRHLKKNEKNALLQFTKEERNTFKKFVLDEIKKGEK